VSCSSVRDQSTLHTVAVEVLTRNVDFCNPADWIDPNLEAESLMH